MSQDSDFRKPAQHCIEQSASASDTETKAHWLRIAQGWMTLATAAPSEARDGADSTYQVAVLEKDGSIASGPASVQAASDAGVIAQAKQLVDGKTVEVTQGDRLVATFPPSE
jgi:hypothetical protein